MNIILPIKSAPKPKSLRAGAVDSYRAPRPQNDVRGATSKGSFYDDSKRGSEVLRFPVESVAGV